MAMQLQECAETFLLYLQFEKRRSPHTIISYRTDISQFVFFVGNQSYPMSIEALSPIIIRGWIVDLINNHITPRAVNRKISTLNSWCKYLIKQGILDANPMLKVMAPKMGKKLTLFIEEKAMFNLLESPTHFPHDFEGKRNKLIIELFYATGMRLAELINLRITDVDLYTLNLKVLGKRNKERILPFTRKLKIEMETYLEHRKDLPSAHPWLFLTKKGEKMYAKAVYRIINQYLSIVSTVEKRSPHVIRHSFATHMLNNGADINAIKELLGHSSLSATQVYTHNTVEKLKTIHKQAHPKG